MSRPNTGYSHGLDVRGQALRKQLIVLLYLLVWIVKGQDL